MINKEQQKVLTLCIESQQQKQIVTHHSTTILHLFSTKKSKKEQKKKRELRNMDNGPLETVCLIGEFPVCLHTGLHKNATK